MLYAGETAPSWQGSETAEAIKHHCFSCVSRTLKDPRFHGEYRRGVAAAPRNDDQENIVPVAFFTFQTTPPSSRGLTAGSISPLSPSLDPPAKPEDDIGKNAASAAFFAVQIKPSSSRTHVRDLTQYPFTKIPPSAVQLFGMTKAAMSSPGFAKQIVRGSIKQKDPSTSCLRSFRLRPPGFAGQAAQDDNNLLGAPGVPGGSKILCGLFKRRSLCGPKKTGEAIITTD